MRSRAVIGSALAKIGLIVQRRKSFPPGVNLFLDLARYFPRERLAVIDVGANVGTFAFSVKQAFPDAVVECFEPVPSTFDALSAAVSGWSDVRCHRIALSDRTDRVQMEALPLNCGNAICTDPSDGRETVVVDSKRLDDHLAAAGETFVHLLKIDTEGHDMAVLRGARNTLRTGRVGVLMVEVTFCSANKRHCQFPDVLSYLEPLGMRFGGVVTTWCLQDRPAHMAWGDVMFVSEDVLRRAAGESQLWRT